MLNHSNTARVRIHGAMRFLHYLSRPLCLSCARRGRRDIYDRALCRSHFPPLRRGPAEAGRANKGLLRGGRAVICLLHTKRGAAKYSQAVPRSMN